MCKSLRIIFLFVVFLTLSIAASAQKTLTFSERLATPDPSTGAAINVSQYGDAADLIRNLESRRTAQKINGYRVRIFFDNSQYARDKGLATRARFNELFPNTWSNMVYENPYFKVTVGNCLTNEEAVILWGRVRSSFNTAFVVREEIPLAVFGE